MVHTQSIPKHDKNNPALSTESIRTCLGWRKNHSRHIKQPQKVLYNNTTKKAERKTQLVTELIKKLLTVCT